MLTGHTWDVIKYGRSGSARKLSRKDNLSLINAWNHVKVEKKNKFTRLSSDLCTHTTCVNTQKHVYAYTHPIIIMDTQRG